MHRHRIQKQQATTVCACAMKTRVGQWQFLANTPALPAGPSIKNFKPGDRDKYIGPPPPYSETEGGKGEWPCHSTGEAIGRIHS